MKTTELITVLWRALDEADQKPLSEAEEKLYTAIHFAVMAYKDEVKLGQPAKERRCLICGVPVSRCCC